MELVATSGTFQSSLQGGGGGSAALESSDKRLNSELSAEEQRQLQQLQQRDREVRAHEQAHLRVGRDLVRGGASFSYQKGPDGNQYAVEGEVRIDTSKVPGDPEATEEKAYHIRETALAPTQPSNQDRAVASMASRMAQEAHIEIQRLQRAQAEQAYQETGGSMNPQGTLINQSA